MEPQNTSTPQPDEQPSGSASPEGVTHTGPASPESAAQVPQPVTSEPAALESPAAPADQSPAPPSVAMPTPEPASAASAPTVQVSAPTSVAPASPVVAEETPQPAVAPAPVETAPAASGAVVGGANQSPTAAVSAPTQGGGGKNKKLLVAAVVLLVLVLGGGYVFAFYLPNRPSEVYAKSLTNTGDALDALIGYSGSVQSKDYKSYNVNSTVHVTGTTSFDASLSGAVDTVGDATFKANADIVGEKINANLETVHVSGSATPDVYVQVSGISQFLNSAGLSSFDNLDGKWISVDHTLISSLLAGYNQSASNATKSSVLPTAAELHDAETQVQSVNTQYIFTTDASKAVLTNNKYLGKETENGRDTYHYLVGYNKAHLEAYVTALSTALDNSSLNAWSKTANSGQSLSQSLGIPSLQKSVEKASGNTTFDVWVDAKTKLIDSVQFTNPSDKTSVYTISQAYTGGSSYPFTLQFSGKDPSSGSTEKTMLNLTINSASDTYTGSLDSTEGTSNVSMNFTLTPSKNAIHVTAPAGAESIDNVLTQLGLGDNVGGF